MIKRLSKKSKSTKIYETMGNNKWTYKEEKRYNTCCNPNEKKMGVRGEKKEILLTIFLNENINNMPS